MASASKVALITGAGSGIGRAVALALLAGGYRTVLVGRTAAKLEETAGLAKADAKQALIIAADVTDPQAVTRMYDETVGVFGRVDVLFNNAGAFPPRALFEDITPEDWNSIVSVNLTGAFLAAQGAFRVMKNQNPRGGRIINNGSVSSHVPRPNSAPYTATKHAITGLTRSISLDGRKYDIACGQIDIGNAATELTKAIAASGASQPTASGAEPTMDVEDVGRAVLYMAGLPLSANVQFMTLMATKMPFIGRG